MKPVTFLLLSFLLLTLATKSSIANQELVGLPAPVYDTEGHMLRAGTEYYVVSAIRGAGGGGLTIGRAPRNATGCPRDVIQLRSDLMKGRPVTFTPVDSTKRAIRVSTDLNIKFSTENLPSCVKSTVWRVLKSSNSDKQWSVAIGGVEGNPSVDTVANWFQIQKDNAYGYKLTFCPTEICRCDVLCRDLGIYSEDDGTRSLVLNGVNTFSVVFVKAASESINLINAE